MIYVKLQPGCTPGGGELDNALREREHVSVWVVQDPLHENRVRSVLVDLACLYGILQHLADGVRVVQSFCGEDGAIAASATDIIVFIILFFVIYCDSQSIKECSSSLPKPKIDSLRVNSNGTLPPKRQSAPRPNTLIMFPSRGHPASTHPLPSVVAQLRFPPTQEFGQTRTCGREKQPSG